MIRAITAEQTTIIAIPLTFDHISDQPKGSKKIFTHPTVQETSFHSGPIRAKLFVTFCLFINLFRSPGISS